MHFFLDFLSSFCDIFSLNYTSTYSTVLVRHLRLFYFCLFPTQPNFLGLILHPSDSNLSKMLSVTMPLPWLKILQTLPCPLGKVKDLGWQCSWCKPCVSPSLQPLLQTTPNTPTLSTSALPGGKSRQPCALPPLHLLTGDPLPTTTFLLNLHASAPRVQSALRSSFLSTEPGL